MLTVIWKKIACKCFHSKLSLYVTELRGGHADKKASGPLRTKSALPWENNLEPHGIEGWIVTRAGVDAVSCRKFFVSLGNRIPVSQSSSPVLIHYNDSVIPAPKTEKCEKEF
jgi:hypothetical protein